jgi:RNA polymerase sigma-70 factor (ECF subfamily)
LQVIDWQIIIKKHGPTVWQIAYRLLGNHEDAADCFQETFVSALKFSKRQNVRNFPALLTRLASARAIDQLRRRFNQSRSKTVTDDWDSVQCTNPGPIQHAQQKELTMQLRKALSQLPPQEAQIFSLRYLNDMSYREIAKIIGIKTNAVGVLLHRTRAKLRESVIPANQDR